MSSRPARNIGWDKALRWSAETTDLFSTVVVTEKGRHYLIVERLPDGRWDWVVWGPTGAAPGVTGSRADRHEPNTQRVQGTAATAPWAMIAAEHATAMLGVDLEAFQTGQRGPHDPNVVPLYGPMGAVGG